MALYIYIQFEIHNNTHNRKWTLTEKFINMLAFKKNVIRT